MKKITLSLFTFILFTFFFNLGCGSSNKKNPELELNIKVHKFYSWLNLMPGGPHSFHFSSEFLIELNENTNYDLLKFNKVIVKQGDNIINEFIPETEREIIIEDGKEFLYISVYSKSNVPIPQKLNSNQNADFLFFISEGDENPRTTIYSVKNKTIEETF